MRPRDRLILICFDISLMSFQRQFIGRNDLLSFDRRPTEEEMLHDMNTDMELIQSELRKNDKSQAPIDQDSVK